MTKQIPKRCGVLHYRSFNLSNMPIFKIEDRQIVVEVEVYEVEAATAEEALDLYCDELAGSISPVRVYTREPIKGEEEIEVVEN